MALEQKIDGIDKKLEALQKEIMMIF